tara:strand:+ start:2562 stop:2972 length:411 start_codon:yes stop_codon:yes gene_type:complete
MASGIGPDLPLVVTSADGAYGLIKVAYEALVQDFKNLVLTSPGEKIMDPEFGVGIRNFLFEPQDSLIYDEIHGRVEEQVAKYLPSIKILGMEFNVSNDTTASDMIDNGILYVKIVFRITTLDLTSSLIVTLRPQIL